MGCGTSFVKYVLFFFNLVVALMGLAIVGIGVAVLLKWSAITYELQKNTGLSVAPWVFIIVGGVMFVIAFFGCCGAIRESHCMVVTYAIFLLVIIIVQVVLAVLMFTYADSIQDALVRAVRTTFDSSRNSPNNDVRTSTAAVYNNLQLQLECCGANGPFDYGASGISLDASCCASDGVINNLFRGACTSGNAHQTGCATTVGDLYQRWNKTIAAVAIGVACVEVVGALFALCLANSIRNMDRRSRY